MKRKASGLFLKSVSVWGLLATILTSGCAAVSNPVADGIPVSRVPAEILGRPKADLKPIPLTLLRQTEPDVYRVDRGDVLAIVAENLIAPKEIQPPIQLPNINNDRASVGFPVPVTDEGTIQIPRIKSLNVKGKTLAEIEKMIREEGSGKNGGPQLINENSRVSVQILQKRSYQILVVREDTQPVPIQGAGGAVFGATKRGNGFTIRLNAYENDILRALNASGGPPGLDAENEVIIQRGKFDPNKPGKNTIKIPLRIYPDQPLPFCEEDIILRDGDIVTIRARDTDFFYIAGVTTSQQVALPRDYDVDVIQALAIVRGPLLNGGFSANPFVAQAFNSGIGFPSPSLVTILRQLPNGQQIPIRVDVDRAFQDPRERIRIVAGDIVVLQERPGDAILRYLSTQLRFTSTAQTISAGSVNQVLTATNP